MADDWRDEELTVTSINRYPDLEDSEDCFDLALHMIGKVIDELPETRLQPAHHAVYATRQPHRAIKITKQNDPGYLIALGDVEAANVFFFGFTLGADVFVWLSERTENDMLVFVVWHRVEGPRVIGKPKTATSTQAWVDLPLAMATGLHPTFMRQPTPGTLH